MKTLLKIAWRNLWRNKKRTLITMASIFVAMVLALMMRSMQLGTYDNMIDSAVQLSTGHIQIQGKGYWEDKSINKIIYYSDSLFNKVEATENVSIVVPRLESFALASSGNQSKGIMVIGTDPQLENELTKLKQKMVRGEYFKKNENGILVAEKLAEFLGVDVKDTLVLIGQGYHGVSAAAQYEIKGIFKFPVPELNSRLIYMPIQEAGFFYAAYDMLTSYTIMLKDGSKIESTVDKISEYVDDSYDIMMWDKMNPEVVQAIQGDNAGGIFMLGILYIVVGFGVFGTMMMMTMERRKEFAVMIAVGLQKGKLGIIVLWETIFIGIISILIGIVFSFPILLYFYYNPIRLTGSAAESYQAFGIEPIMPFSLDPVIFSSQTVTVLIITLIAVLYPLFIISKFNVLKGMRS